MSSRIELDKDSEVGTHYATSGDVDLNKAEIGKVRQRAFDAYLDGGTESVVEAAAAAELSESRFYALLATYRQTRDLRDLVPHATPGIPRGKYDHKELKRALRSLIQKHPSRKPALIVAHVNHWFDQRTLNPKPSRSTVLRTFDALWREAQPQVSLKGWSKSSRLLADPQSIGDLIILDHVTADLTVSVGDQAVRPVLSLAFDQKTRLIADWRFTFGTITPEYVYELLSRLDRPVWTGIAAQDLSDEPPILLLNAQSTDEWRDLVAALEATQYREIRLRMRKELQAGYFANLAFGGEIGRLPILPRFATRDPYVRGAATGTRKGVEVNRLVAAKLICDAVRRHNETVRRGLRAPVASGKLPGSAVPDNRPPVA